MLKKLVQLGFISLFISMIGVTALHAQRNVDYRSLAFQNQQQNIYITHFTLPGDQAGTVKFVTAFRISYQFLPFKKSDGDNKEAFLSSIGLSIEMFNAKERVKKGNFDDIDIEGLEPAGRAFWNDTAYAATYEKTKSGDTFIEGYMTVDVQPGLYNYLMELERGAENSERPSRIRQVQISPYSGKSSGSIILGESVSDKDGAKVIDLLNYGNNARYGKDYFALVQLPNYTEDNSYSVSITKVDVADKDTTNLENMITKELGPDQIYNNIKPVLSTSKKKPGITLESSDDGHAFALFKIENSQFPNALYRLKVNSNDQELPVAQGAIRSFWPEIPTSLLNLEIALEMTKFILPEQEYKELRSGSKKEKERKFREFWKSKDPTPDTEYNELMTEYYNRVDYAYENFSTSQLPGFESDQGKVYIKYGEPDNIERKFPTDQPTTEIWTYGSKKFVFQATSGFGDFKLVSK